MKSGSDVFRNVFRRTNLLCEWDCKWSQFIQIILINKWIEAWIVLFARWKLKLIKELYFSYRTFKRSKLFISKWHRCGMCHFKINSMLGFIFLTLSKPVTTNNKSNFYTNKIPANIFWDGSVSISNTFYVCLSEWGHTYYKQYTSAQFLCAQHRLPSKKGKLFCWNILFNQFLANQS